MKPQKGGEKIVAFETPEEQVRFLAELPEAEQIAFLDDTLDDVSKGIALLEKIATAWANGDTAVLVDLLISDLKAKAPDLYQKLLVDRNIRWAEKIETMLRGSGVQLVAMGVAHLAGPDGVQAQLVKRGVKVDSY